MDREIKIAQVITRLDWGGSPEIVEIICRELAKRNINFKLIFGLTKNPSEKTKIFLKEFSSNLIFIKELRREINFFYDLISLIKLYLIFKKEKFNLIHTHTAKAGTLARIAAFLTKIKVIHTPHGHNFYGYFGKFFTKLIILIERFLNFFTDKFIVFTHLEKSDFLKFKISLPEKIEVVYPGKEITKTNTPKEILKEKFGFKKEDKIIGTITRLEAVKGCTYFLQAAKIVLEKEKQVKFIFVGDGSLRKNLEQEVRKNNLEKSIIFLGWQEKIEEIISFLDILVLSSLNEAIGLVLIEAQLQGVPIIATRVGGVPEIVREKETALLVEPKNSFALAEAIFFLLENSLKAKEMGEKAKIFASQKFSKELMCKEIFKVYEKFF